eukprot:g4349.t1
MNARVFRQLHFRFISPHRARLRTTKAGINFLEWAGRIIPQGPIVTSIDHHHFIYKFQLPLIGVKTSWKWTWLALMNELAPQSQSGAFVRAPSAFGENIGSKKFPVETDRYHLYIGNACPWCHRVVLAIIMLGLEDVISIGSLQDDPERASRGGWVIANSSDPITQCTDLRCVYDKCCGDPEGYRGRCTAPLLIDKKQMKIVSNESSLIIENLNSVDFGVGTGVDLRPPKHLQEIQDLNKKIYDSVNNGVYKCGFATSQEAYDTASEALFAELDTLEQHLMNSRFLTGEKFTESDLRLYPTLIRFDSIYATIFHCSKKRFSNYPNLNRWLRDVYRIEIPSVELQIRHSIDLADARRSYCELFPLNPSGIIYHGPGELDQGLVLDDHAKSSPESIETIFHIKDA